MVFLSQKNKILILSSLLLIFCVSVLNAQELKGICPRLEGIKFLDCLSPPVCVKDCPDYSGSFYVCQSFRVCGKTCNGVKPDSECPDPSTYSKCDPTPSTVCGKQCAEGTKPITITCTGKCYQAVYDSYTYKNSVAGGCTQNCTNYSTETRCTTTEAGQVCESINVCTNYETVCEPARCETASRSCVKDYIETDNVLQGCRCSCGPNGESRPGTSCGSPPPDEC